jgi:hypothetical protein
MYRIAIDNGIFRDSWDVVSDFFKEKGINLESFRRPDDASVDGYACATYNIQDVKMIGELIERLKERNPYAKPKIFIMACGEWQPMTRDDEQSKPVVVQNISAGQIGQIAGHDVTINNQYLIPKNYLEILERAIQDDPKFSVAPESEKKTFLSKIAALKNDPWLAAIGPGIILQTVSKIFGP